ncbi:MAG: hypothetical protein HY670_10515 [Chloroflexi bacterium]|nr:hypothetical protein [Chloroflexota bacterium]
MRQSTRRRYYGRSNIASSLRSALNELQEAIKLSQKPLETPLSVSLGKVMADLQRAEEAYLIFNVGRKRIARKIEREKKHIAELLAEVTSIPVTKEEKLIAKTGRKKPHKERVRR